MADTKLVVDCGGDPYYVDPATGQKVPPGTEGAVLITPEVEIREEPLTQEEINQREADRVTALDGNLFTDRTTITADGVDAAVVTAWRFSEPGPVQFVVNGAPIDVALTNNAAELEITAAQPGPIEVMANGKTIIITAGVA